jgi:2-dehydro-3-deoxyphosphooctonate aldolase (KDO 8-P synthase)
MKHNPLPPISGLSFSKTGNFLLIAGPCVVESREVVFETATVLKSISWELQIPLVFKASYRKANRSRIDSFRGIGDKKALQILADVRADLELPVITDVHETVEVAKAAEIADILQIPAFLCRQTDLVMAAARTGKPVNLKKGQFLSPESMRFVCEKAVETGNRNILVTERGTSFGYGDLVVDFRGIPVMKSWGFPVILDITHSLQRPNQPEGISGGHPELIETMALAGIAAGVDGIFMETHPDPANARSDGANMLPLSKSGKLIEKLHRIHRSILDL